MSDRAKPGGIIIVHDFSRLREPAAHKSASVLERQTAMTRDWNTTRKHLTDDLEAWDNTQWGLRGPLLKRALGHYLDLIKRLEDGWCQPHHVLMGLRLQLRLDHVQLLDMLKETRTIVTAFGGMRALGRVPLPASESLQDVVTSNPTVVVNWCQAVLELGF